MANLAGTLAYVCCLALWVTSPDCVRRRYFEVFYRTHIAGFLGLLLFSAMHYRGKLIAMQIPADVAGTMLGSIIRASRVGAFAACSAPSCCYVQAVVHSILSKMLHCN